MKLPSDFIARTRKLLGDEYEAFEQALGEEASISIRRNETKSTLPVEDPVAWCSTGSYLAARPSFTLDPLFHAGTYYVQEASSMFLAQAIKQYVDTPVAYLDLCAAPGGKTTLALQHLPEESLVVANEIVRSRAYILAENVVKWGNPNHVVVNQTPEQLGRLTDFFDIVAADVPCSGEGMFRKDADAIDHWSVDNVRLCAARQRDIVSAVWPSLKPGGLFVYSTCTYNREENEENIRWIVEELGAESLHIAHDCPQIAPSWDEDLNLYRFLPHRTRGEGFSIALLRKGESAERNYTTQKGKGRSRNNNPTVKFPEECKEWITDRDCFHFLVAENRLYAAQKRWAEAVATIRSSFAPLSFGIELAEIKGKDIIPSHSLSMSRNLNREVFPSVELDTDTALDFLRKESITLPEETPRGFVLCLYQSIPLGWVKNIGSRCNNLYPQEWRIRLQKS